MQFEVVEISPAANKLVLVGRLDATTVGQVETRFTAAVAASGRSAVIDLTGLEFLSSLGIRLLLSSSRVVTRRGGTVVMFGAQPMVAEVLEAMALDDVLPLVPTEAEAMARLA
ncbi:STAS domain-containing protein [Falsiroseomonas selenitidurans]|uniref:Anti-sigma factor antagonist n=1 Tax=Falsiroseomonas selenitidurans TaxID=2716335 RepID=A0ABX1E122_9PROT|nr:STAS domain-containing protein [Falsiroseomonas selenitidurans]NKC30845.1 STAS domain-containing protein [Falsiroseomonas selenitidurans]